MNLPTPEHWSYSATAVVAVAYFGLLYVGAGVIGSAVTSALVANGRGRRLDPRSPAPGQCAREWRLGASSVLIFGLGTLIPLALVKAGWATVAMDAGAGRIALEVIALVLWNDVHFYLMHRALHHPRLRDMHLSHHRSVVTTPWSTYAFHPVEALMLGSVLIPPMLVWPFSLEALLLLPLLSIVYNTVGHSNTRALRGRWRLLSNAEDHHLHHACYRGNYGFFFRFMDVLGGTRLPPDAAQAAFDASLEREARKARSGRG